MKTEKIASFLLLVFVLVACKKEVTEETVPSFYTTASAELNGKEWVGKPKLRKIGVSSHYSLDLVDNTKDGNLQLVFIQFPLTIGQYALYRNSTIQGFLVPNAACFDYREVGFNPFSILEDDEVADWLEITSIDSLKGEVKGNFQLSLVIDSTKFWLSTGMRQPGGMDTLVFLEGSFVSEIND